MIVRTHSVGFSPDRRPQPRVLKIGFEGDNMVERIMFRLPTVARRQSATLMMDGVYADMVTLCESDEAGRYYVDLTAELIGQDGRTETYVVIDGDDGERWQSGMLYLDVGAIPDTEIEIEQRFPTAVEQIRAEMAQHRAEMADVAEEVAEDARQASAAADRSAAAAESADASASAAADAAARAASSEAAAEAAEASANAAAARAASSETSAAGAADAAESASETAAEAASAAADAADNAQKKAADAQASAQEAQRAEGAASASAANAAASESGVRASADEAKTYAANAKASESNAGAYAAGAASAERSANTAASNAGTAAQRAESAAAKAASSETAAAQSAESADASKAAAAQSAASAASAAQTAEAAEASASAAAEGAESAAWKAENAAVNPPIIGKNGNWHLWDFAAGAYVDSGMPSRGEHGGAADWNEQDPSASGYVTGRTHWQDEGDAVVPAANVQTKDGTYFISHEIHRWETAPVIVPGLEYTVIYGEERYVCIATAVKLPYGEDGTMVDAVMLGNVAAFTGVGDSGEPFVYMHIDDVLREMLGLGGGVYGMVIPLDGDTSMRLIGVERNRKTYKLDKKYLDLEWIPESRVPETCIAPERMVIEGDPYHGNIDELTSDGVSDGQMLAVYCDGVRYACKVVKVGDMAVVGNLAVIGSEDTGEPFAIMLFSNHGSVAFVGDDGEISHAVAVYSIDGEEQAVTLPEKYLPGTAAVVEAARVGQAAVVAAVDEKGRPTRWKAAAVEGSAGGTGTAQFATYTINLSVINGEYTAERVDFFDALAENLRLRENVIVYGSASMGDNSYGCFTSTTIMLIDMAEPMIGVMFYSGSMMQCTIAADGSVTVAME